MDNPNTAVNPQELTRAQSMWGEFTRFSKVGIIFIVTLLVLMAVFLL